jgi:hypothetical protein
MRNHGAAGLLHAQPQNDARRTLERDEPGREERPRARGGAAARARRVAQQEVPSEPQGARRSRPLNHRIPLGRRGGTGGLSCSPSRRSPTSATARPTTPLAFCSGRMPPGASSAARSTERRSEARGGSFGRFGLRRRDFVRRGRLATCLLRRETYGALVASFRHTNRTFWLVSVSYVLGLTASFALLFHQVAYLRELGLSAGTAALAAGLVGLVCLPG